MIEIAQSDGFITFRIRGVPRASRSERVGEIDGAIKVTIASPPVDGAANAEVIKLFAKMLGIAKSSVEIVSGQTSKSKQIRITGINADQLRNALYLADTKSA